MEAVDAILAPLGSATVGVFSPPNARAVATARAIARDRNVEVVEGLAPIRSPYPGVTEEEVARLDPLFARMIADYRNGLHSAYDIPRGAGESILEFEARVANGIDEVLDAGCSLSVVVGHRSTITATLLRVLRTLNSYPESWYGHVTIPIGSISTVMIDDQKRFVAVGPLCALSPAPGERARR